MNDQSEVTDLSILNGMRGEDVKLLQNRLKKLGYDIPSEEINEEIFDSKPEEVVIKFQEDTI